MPADRALAALDDLCAAVDRAQVTLDAVRRRADVLRDRRSSGVPFSRIIESEPPPLVVQMITAVLDELAEAGAAFRRAEARALSEEGLSQEAIARLFGVTRQRVGALLAQSERRRAPRRR